MRKKLVVLLGPTAVGKTELSLQLAERLGCPIISADSRQLYRDMVVATAAPTREQLARVPHHFIGTLSLTDYYSAAQYEADALALIEQLFTRHDTLLLTGGSMMYIDAVCNGIDEIPTISDEVRRAVVTPLAPTPQNARPNPEGTPRPRNVVPLETRPAPSSTRPGQAPRFKVIIP